MIQLKIGCIKINLIDGAASFNIGTAINLQNTAYRMKQPKVPPHLPRRPLVPDRPIPPIEPEPPRRPDIPRIPRRPRRPIRSHPSSGM